MENFIFEPPKFHTIIFYFFFLGIFLQIFGQSSNQRTRKGGWYYIYEQMVHINPNWCWRSENGDKNASNLGHKHHVLDDLCSNEHLLRLASHHHGPSRRKIVSNSRCFPHRLFRRQHSLNRPCLRSIDCPHCSKVAQKPSRPDPITTSRRRFSPVNFRNGDCSSRWAEAS